MEGVQVRLWLTQGDVEAAVEWIAARGLAGFLTGEPPLPPETGAALPEVEALTLARVLLAAGRPTPALAVLDDLLRTAATLKHQHIVEVEVWRALAFQALGADTAALAALERALRLGEPEGYVWTLPRWRPGAGAPADPGRRRGGGPGLCPPPAGGLPRRGGPARLGWHG